jgi:hypothetical protein
MNIPIAFSIFNRQRLTGKIITGLVVALIALPTFAQLGDAPMPQITAPNTSGPSLEETLQWLKEKIDNLGDILSANNLDYDFLNDAYEMEFSGCTFYLLDQSFEIAPRIPNVTDAAYIRRNYMPFTIVGQKASLSDIDSANLSYSSLVMFKTIGGAEQITRTGGMKLYESAYRDNNYENDMRLSNSTTAKANEHLQQEIRSRQLIDHECSNHSCQKENYFTIRVWDTGLRTRIASAFQHAIELCQHQKQENRQKEAAEPKKKEIF